MRSRFASAGYAPRRQQASVQQRPLSPFGFAAQERQSAPTPQPSVAQPAQQQVQAVQPSPVPAPAPQPQSVPSPPVQVSAIPQPQPKSPVSAYRKVPPVHPTRQKKLLSTIMHATVEVDRVTRQSVQRVKHSFEPPYISAMRSKKQRMLVKSYYAFGMISFVAAMFFGSMYLFHREQKVKVVNSVLGKQTVQSENGVETVPSADDLKSYVVEPQLPRYLRISSINVWSRIRVSEALDVNTVGPPTNVFDVGWYSLSQRPGASNGTSVLIARAAGPTSHGVFWDLNKMTVGQIFDLEKGSGEIIHYKVKKSGKITAADLDGKKLLADQSQFVHQIKLVTANDTFDRATGAYADPYLVVAERVNN